MIEGDVEVAVVVHSSAAGSALIVIAGSVLIKVVVGKAVINGVAAIAAAVVTGVGLE